MFISMFDLSGGYSVMSKTFRLFLQSAMLGLGAYLVLLEQLVLDDLAAGEVVIDAHYSSVNYKDALAATGKGQILRRFPLNGGIDVAGEIPERLPGVLARSASCGT